MKSVDLRYTQHVNWNHGISGRLWQGRFFSCPLDEEHLWAAIRYVERNPVRARLVRKAEHYPWSSAAAHCGLRVDPALSPMPGSQPCGTADWSAWLAEKMDEKMLFTLRLSTRTGRPVGGRDFLAKLEIRLGHRLQARPIAGQGSTSQNRVASLFSSWATLGLILTSFWLAWKASGLVQGSGGVRTFPPVFHSINLYALWIMLLQVADAML